MTQFDTRPPAKPRAAVRATMPAWRQALIVLCATGAVAIAVGLLPHFG